MICKKCNSSSYIIGLETKWCQTCVVNYHDKNTDYYLPKGSKDFYPISIENFNDYHACVGEDYLDQGKEPISTGFFIAWLFRYDTDLGEKALKLKLAEGWTFEINSLLRTEPQLLYDSYDHTNRDGTLIDNYPIQEQYNILVDIANSCKTLNQLFWESLF